MALRCAEPNQPVAAFFLRQPSRPRAPRPVAKRGRVAGRGTWLRLLPWSLLFSPWSLLSEEVCTPASANCTPERDKPISTSSHAPALLHTLKYSTLKPGEEGVTKACP